MKGEKGDDIKRTRRKTYRKQWKNHSKEAINTRSWEIKIKHPLRVNSNYNTSNILHHFI